MNVDGRQGMLRIPLQVVTGRYGGRLLRPDRLFLYSILFVFGFLATYRSGYRQARPL